MSAAQPRTAAIILAAGKGTRMKSALPKVMHQIAGRSMIGHVVANLGPLGSQPNVVVVAPGMDQVAAEVAPLPIAVQTDQLGTGHAVACARAALGDFPAARVRRWAISLAPCWCCMATAHSFQPQP